MGQRVGPPGHHHIAGGEPGQHFHDLIVHPTGSDILFLIDVTVLDEHELNRAVSYDSRNRNDHDHLLFSQNNRQMYEHRVPQRPRRIGGVYEYVGGAFYRVEHRANELDRAFTTKSRVRRRPYPHHIGRAVRDPGDERFRQFALNLHHGVIGNRQKHFAGQRPLTGPGGTGYHHTVRRGQQMDQIDRFIVGRRREHALLGGFCVGQRQEGIA